MVIDLDMALLLQRYEAAASDVSTTESPAQNVVEEPAVIRAWGSGLTFTSAMDETAVHPLLSVILTE
jgi:hypothetical protein